MLEQARSRQRLNRFPDIMRSYDAGTLLGCHYLAGKRGGKAIRGILDIQQVPKEGLCRNGNAYGPEPCDPAEIGKYGEVAEIPRHIGNPSVKVVAAGFPEKANRRINNDSLFSDAGPARNCNALRKLPNSCRDAAA